jgi:U3 small nucleolar RNA-associated protein 14
MDNPWFKNTSSAEDNEKMELYYTGYKKLWGDINERKERDAKREAAEEERKQKEKEAGQKSQALQDPSSNKREKAKPDKKKLKKRKAVAVVQPEPETDSEGESEVTELPLELNPKGELTVDDLNNLLTFADHKIVSKASKQLKALRPEKVKTKVKGGKKKRKREEDEDEDEERRQRSRDGDFGEIRDLRVDESEINFEGRSGLDLISVREREGSSLARKLEKLDRDVTDSTPTPKTPPVKLINVSDYLQIGKSSKFNMKEVERELKEDDESDSDDGQLQNIAEAFEDDDVMAEFQSKKEEDVEAGKPKEVDLSLPGWGEWGGKDLKPSRRKKKQFVLKGPPPPPRKDALLSHVILNEKGNEKVREHQVRQLPFPYSRVKDFEKMVRAPVGRTWLPEQAMKSLITPKVITRLGAVIQPISEDVLMNKPEKSQNLKLAGLKIHK